FFFLVQRQSSITKLESILLPATLSGAECSVLPGNSSKSERKPCVHQGTAGICLCPGREQGEEEGIA
uniref:Uncharacterized protein n=1 Tax=Zosterops lateralis melanops TaxID=1220523 RepID=A0A8D2NWV4_ZOSLA